jgi:hypothetical protein
MIKIKIQPIQPIEFPETADVLGRAFATLSSSRAIYEGRSKSDIERRISITFGGLIKTMSGQVFVSKQDGRIVFISPPKVIEMRRSISDLLLPS